MLLAMKKKQGDGVFEYFFAVEPKKLANQRTSHVTKTSELICKENKGAEKYF